MSADPQPSTTSRAMRWTGLVIGVVPALLLVVDAVMKLVKPEFVVKATTELGFPESSIFGTGLALLASAVLYLIPRTAVVGAILLTAYLGGAVATHVHVGHGPFEISFPIVFAALLWGGLCLRDGRLRDLVFSRR